MNIKKFVDFISEAFETKESGNWMVYTKDNKVIGWNLTHDDAMKLSNIKGQHMVGGQNGKSFSNIEDAQKWFDTKLQKRNTEIDSKTKQITEDPVRAKLLTLSNLLKRRFKTINPYLFAYWVGKTFAVKKFLFVSKVERSNHEKDVKWVYCIIGDYYYDFNGFYSSTDLMDKEELNKWNMNDFTFNGDFEMVTKLKQDTSDMSNKNKQELISTIIQFNKNLK
jgi:hypothetical protein